MDNLVLFFSNHFIIVLVFCDCHPRPTHERRHKNFDIIMQRSGHAKKINKTQIAPKAVKKRTASSLQVLLILVTAGAFVGYLHVIHILDRHILEVHENGERSTKNPHWNQRNKIIETWSDKLSNLDDDKKIEEETEVMLELETDLIENGEVLPNSRKGSPILGSKRGHIECDVDVDDLVYWNDRQGYRDLEFVSPFHHGYTDKNAVKYVTFEPDRGGWNNMRMSMEIMFVFAAATGRTIVLPPSQPLYLLNVSFTTTKLNLLL